MEKWKSLITMIPNKKKWAKGFKFGTMTKTFSKVQIAIRKYLFIFPHSLVMEPGLASEKWFL